jgi:hypothetical protein
MTSVQSGQVYGSLMVLQRAMKSSKSGNVRFMCRCLCGLIQPYRANELSNGRRTRCHVCDRVAKRSEA